MEYVEGRSGAQLLQTPRAGSGPETAVEIGVQACAGLDYAHRQGIIHRDVKPGNLMVIGGPAGAAQRRTRRTATGEMTVKLTDFGIARAAEQTRITQVGSVVGTAAYLAPEQARGEEATPGLRRLRARRRASTSSSPAACPGRARPWPSWRSAARTSARCRPAPTTPTVPETLVDRGPARARGRPRPRATDRAASSRGALRAGPRGRGAACRRTARLPTTGARPAAPTTATRRHAAPSEPPTPVRRAGARRAPAGATRPARQPSPRAGAPRSAPPAPRAQRDRASLAGDRDPGRGHRRRSCSLTDQRRPEHRASAS